MSQQAHGEADFVERLDRVASQHADSTAIIDGDRALTYAELTAGIGERAQQLADAGLRAGDRVALIAENSAYYLITAFAVWKAGGVLVTIYPASGVADLEYSIGDSDPVLVLVDEHTDDAVRQAVPADMALSMIDDRFSVERVRIDAKPNPEGLRAPIYLICYTSGTTSRPKAIMLSAASVLNGADTYGEVWHLGPDDRTIVCLPMAWLYGLATTSMATLLYGGTVVVLRRARPELIVDAIERHGGTFLAGVTTIFTKLVGHLGRRDRSPDLSSLRLCVSGGEPRNEAAFDRWTSFTGCPVHDTFCPSECFPLITYDPVADVVPVPGSAGRLVPRSRLRIVDADGNDVPTGEVGEALTDGPGMFLGYWGDEEQTKAALTADGWYRTRDLVRVDESGYVYVVGRLSDMIIRGGSNVSPAEVERVLREHPAVRDACVVGLPDETYGQSVAAALVPEDREAEGIDSDALKAFVASRLASYKVPSAFHVVDRLPQNTTTGKVDRRQVATALAEAGAATS
ncbi:class I adenylate-forming enzyme family protein [Streptomyces canus]|uniref:class I adenylate-forming enzyme family protein n=1 Tax=Streptomyces canus TaxID=58343 RepID=UPI0033DEB8A9